MGGKPSLALRGVVVAAVAAAAAAAAIELPTAGSAGARGVIGGSAIALGCNKYITSLRCLAMLCGEGNFQSFTLFPETLASRLLNPKNDVLWW